MRMTYYLLFFVLIASCTSKSERLSISKYLLMDDLWQRKASKEEAIKTFGPDFKNVENGITYRSSHFKFPRMAFFFDSSNQLTEQFAMMDELSLKNFKQAINCPWKNIEIVKTFGHSFRSIKSGVCSEKAITYEYVHDLKLFEVRWK